MRARLFSRLSHRGHAHSTPPPRSKSGRRRTARALSSDAARGDGARVTAAWLDSPGRRVTRHAEVDVRGSGEAMGPVHAAQAAPVSKVGALDGWLRCRRRSLSQPRNLRAETRRYEVHHGTEHPPF